MARVPVSCLVAVTLVALGAPRAAHAEAKPSLVMVAGNSDWKVVKNFSVGKGKIKIYGAEPKYDKDGNNLVELLVELKEDNSQYVLKAHSQYWLVLYPHLGNVNARMEFRRILGKDNKEDAYQRGHAETLTSLLVGGSKLLEAWITGPKVSCTISDNACAEYNPAQFEKGLAVVTTAKDGKAAPQAPGPLLILK
jgi:hypothetical protein